jgi:DNA-binding NtrC family response regulator
MTPPLVVCVDDDADLLQATMRVLRNQGYTLMSTSDPTEALDWVGSKDVSVLVSDFEMPKMTGVELTAAARMIRPETVRVLMTGRQTLDTAVAGINQGEIFRYIQKPFEAMVLREIVKEAVQRHKELVTTAADRARAQRRDRIASELENEYPHITHVDRTSNGIYLVPLPSEAAVTGFGIDAILLLGRRT